MKHARTITTAAIAIASIATTPAHATEHDFNVWLAQVASIEASDEVTVRLEAQERFTDDAERLGQLLLRPAVGYRVNDDVSIFAGYAYVFTDPVGPAESNEHRIFQELTIRLVNRDDLTITSRNRLEQRFLEEFDETGWRYRNQIQLRAPISDDVKMVVYTEPFVAINGTPFQRNGIGVWRNFVGFSLPLGDRLSLTPGYLNQTVFRRGEDRSQHIVNVSVGARF